MKRASETLLDARDEFRHVQDAARVLRCVLQAGDDSTVVVGCQMVANQLGEILGRAQDKGLIVRDA